MSSGNSTEMCEVLNRVHDYLGELIRDNLVEDTPRASDLADDVYDTIRGIHTTTEQHSAVGNVASMREALEKIRGLNRYDLGCIRSKKRRDEFDAKVLEIERTVRAALSKPPRNCDRFSDELDAQLEFLNEVWLISVDRDTMLERDRFENWTDLMRLRYAKWLMAPAVEPETKGEVNGRTMQ